MRFDWSRQLETYNYIGVWLFCFWGLVVKEQRLTNEVTKKVVSYFRGGKNHRAVYTTKVHLTYPLRSKTDFQFFNNPHSFLEYQTDW